MDLKEDKNETLDHNIFNYATKELSQDAFIAWLLSYYNDTNDTKHKLYEIAKLFLEKIISESRSSINSLPTDKIQIELQEEKRDITIYFLNEDGKRKKDLVIFFEDKVNSSEGDGQITKYYEKLESKFDNVIPVYFKTSYMTKQEEASLNMIKDRKENPIKSLVIFPQNEIAEFFIPIQTNNLLLNDWIKYFKSMDVSNIKVNKIGNISETLANKDNPNCKRALKLKILDEILFSIKNKLKLERSSVWKWHVGTQIYGDLLYPEHIKSKTAYLIKMYDNKIFLSLNHTFEDENDIFKENYKNNIKNFCGFNIFWNYRDTKRQRASFKFDKDVKSLKCSYKQLEEQIENAIIEMNTIFVKN